MLAVLAEENGLSFADCVETFLKKRKISEAGIDG